MTTKRILILTLAVLLVLPLLFACGRGKDPEDTTAPAAQTVEVDLNGYVMIFDYDKPDDFWKPFYAFYNEVKEHTGADLDFDDDFVNTVLGQTVPTDTKEILVGPTNRAESASYRMGRDDYAVYYENGRIVINGGSTAAVERAMQYFRDNCMKDGGKIVLSTTAYVMRADYPYASFTLGGYDIHDFSIVADNKNAGLAIYLRERIAEATGAVLPIIPEKNDVAAHEIRIGNLSGARKTDAVTGGDYRVEMVGGHLLLHGDTQDGAYSALRAFVANLAGTGNALTLPYTTAAVGTVDDMTFFRLNLPDELPSMAGLYDITYSADSVLDRFLAAKEQLPEEITLIDRVALSDYPLSAATEVYVSTKGNDKNAGTKEAPLATLKAALKKVENRGGGIIWMMGGTYSTNSTITISSLHSGARQIPLFIKAYNGEEVDITSMKPLDTDGSKWDYVDETDPLHADVIDRIKADALPNLIYTTLDMQGWTEDDIPSISTKGPGRLFLGGEEYALAQYPNADEAKIPTELLYFTYSYDSGKVTAKEGSNLYWPWVDRAAANGWNITEEHGWEIRVLNAKDNVNGVKAADNHPEAGLKGEEILSWVNTGDIWYYGSTFEGWEFGYYNLALTTTEHGVTKHWAHTASGAAWTPTSGETPYLGAPKANGYYSLKSMTYNSWGCKTSGNSAAGRNTYILFNAIEALDAPGEWYYEKATGVLYLYQKDEHIDLEDAKPAFSNPASFNTLSIEGASNIVLDGLTFNGASNTALYVKNSDSIIVQDCTFTNTMSTSATFSNCANSAVIYSDFSMAYNTMLSFSDSASINGLYPCNNVVQNNVFHDPAPYEQCSVTPAGCRMVVSHNYFNNTNLQGGGVEAIIEYNLFEGGSKDITDGGFVYLGGISNRANHVRYNLFHMFNATHNAVYNDTMGSGNYMYYNVVSTLHSVSDHNKPWYSSTGWGNVSYGNVTVLRTPAELRDAGSNATVEANGYARATEGDVFNESGLFYFHFGEAYSSGGSKAYYTPLDYDGNVQWPVEQTGDNTWVMRIAQTSTSRVDGKTGTRDAYLAQSLAGHWWDGYKQGDYKKYLGLTTQIDVAAWKDRMPEYINMYYGTQIIMNLKDAVGRGEEDYHIKYFYVPWYLTYDEDGSRKTYTFSGLPEDAVIQIPEYSYLVKTGEGTNDFRVVTVEDHVHTERNEDGSITLTYEEIAAMERARRAPQYSVVMNNVILGSSPKYVKGASGSAVYPIDVNEPASVVTSTTVSASLVSIEVSARGFVPTTYVGNNFMAYDYSEIMPEAYYFYYEITDEGWDMIENATDPATTIDPDEVDNLKELLDGIYGESEIKVGPTFKGFDPLDYFYEVYPDFEEKDPDEYFYWLEEIRYDLMK